MSARKTKGGALVTVDQNAKGETLVEGVAHEGVHIAQFLGKWDMNDDSWQNIYGYELPASFIGMVVSDSFHGAVRSIQELARDAAYQAGYGASSKCASRCSDVPEQFKFQRYRR